MTTALPIPDRARVGFRSLLLIVLAALPAPAQKGGGGTTPPPNPAIALASGGSIYVMNADGTNVRLVLASASDSILLRPAWSPDASEIVFAGNPGGAVRGIYSVRPDGTGLRLITPTSSSSPPNVAWSPVPSPDGRFKIAWTDRAGPANLALGLPAPVEIFVVNPDATGLAMITATPGIGESCVSWSPDATRLAVTTITVVPGGSLNEGWVYGLGLDGAGLLTTTSIQNVTSIPGSPLNGASIVACDWARTQDRIAVAALGAVGGSSYDLWILDLASPATPQRVPVSGSSVSERQPTWSPDDSKLAFWYSGSKSGVFVVNPNGTGLTQLTKGGTAPDWKRGP